MTIKRNIMECSEPAPAMAKRKRSHEDTFEEEQPLIKKAKPISIMQRSGTWRKKRAARAKCGTTSTLTHRLRVSKKNIPMDQLMDLLAADTGIPVSPDNLYPFTLPSANLHKQVRKGVLLKRPSDQELMPAPKPILRRKRSLDDDEDTNSWEHGRKQRCTTTVMIDESPPPKPILCRKHSYDGDDEEDHGYAWEPSRKHNCAKSVTFDNRPATILGKKRANSSEEDIEVHDAGRKRACTRDDSGTGSFPKMMLVAIPLVRCIKRPKRSALKSTTAVTRQKSRPNSVLSGPCSVPTQPMMESNPPPPNQPKFPLEGGVTKAMPSLPPMSAPEGIKPGGFKTHNCEVVQLQQAMPSPGIKLPDRINLSEGFKSPSSQLLRVSSLPDFKSVASENDAIPKGSRPSQATTTLQRIIQDHNYLGAEEANFQQLNSTGNQADCKVLVGGKDQDVDLCSVILSKMSISEGVEAGQAQIAGGKTSIFEDANKTQADECKIPEAKKIQAPGCKVPILAAGVVQAFNAKIPVPAGGDVQEVEGKIPIPVGADVQAVETKILIAAGGDVQAVEGKIPILAGGNVQAVEGKIPILAGGDVQAVEGKIPILAGGDVQAVEGKIPILAGGDVQVAEAKIPIAAGGEAQRFNAKTPIPVGEDFQPADAKIPVVAAGEVNESAECKIPVPAVGEANESAEGKILIHPEGQSGNYTFPAGAEVGSGQLPVEEVQTVGCKMPISSLIDMLKSKLSLSPGKKWQARAEKVTENPFPMHLRNERRGHCHLQKLLFVSHCARIIA